MDWLSKIPNWIKIPIKVLLPALTIFSGLIMLSNDLFLEKLFLLEMRQKNGFIFGIMFVICLSLIISYVAVFVLEKTIYKIKLFRYKKLRVKELEALSPRESSILLTMYKSNSRTLELEYSDANTTLLLSKKMIGGSQVSTFGMYFSFFLQPWVVEYYDTQVSKYELLLKSTEKQLKKVQDNEIKSSLLKMKNECEQNIKFLTEKIDSKSIRQQWLGQ